MRITIVVMGVAGCGKTTIGKAIAGRLGLGFVDGDDVHSPEAVAKMSAGQPLTDDDRWPWLDRIGDLLKDKSRFPDGLVVACSALRKRYRDRLRAASSSGLRFIFLEGSIGLIRSRMAARSGHYMPPSLLESQFAALEPPLGEPGTAIISIIDRPDEIAADSLAWLSVNT